MSICTEIVKALKEYPHTAEQLQQRFQCKKISYKISYLRNKGYIIAGLSGCSTNISNREVIYILMHEPGQKQPTINIQ